MQEAGADYLLTVKANQKELAPDAGPNGCPNREQLFSPPRAVAAAVGAHGATEESGGRHEIRTLCATVINPEQACFPGAAQCAVILRRGLGDQPDPQYLLTSRAPEHLPARQWLEGQRDYWGIEAGLHQRLDVSADEDRSRVRHRSAVWVLAMFRRISVSLFMHWRAQNTKRAKATLPDFHEKEMGLEHQRRAFALVVSEEIHSPESSWASRGARRRQAEWI